MNSLNPSMERQVSPAGTAWASIVAIAGFPLVIFILFFMAVIVGGFGAMAVYGIPTEVEAEQVAKSLATEYRIFVDNGIKFISIVSAAFSIWIATVLFDGANGKKVAGTFFLTWFPVTFVLTFIHPSASNILFGAGVSSGVMFFCFGQMEYLAPPASTSDLTSGGMKQLARDVPNDAVFSERASGMVRLRLIIGASLVLGSLFLLWWGWAYDMILAFMGGALLVLVLFPILLLVFAQSLCSGDKALRIDRSGIRFRGVSISWSDAGRIWLGRGSMQRWLMIETSEAFHERSLPFGRRLLNFGAINYRKRFFGIHAIMINLALFDAKPQEILHAIEARRSHAPR